MYLNYVESEIGLSMNAHESINHEREFDPNNPYIPMLDEIDDAT
jgi:hypothetical protein